MNNIRDYNATKASFEYINSKNRSDILHILDMLDYVINDINTEPPLAFAELTKMIPFGVYREALFEIIEDYGYENVNRAYLHIVLFNYEEFSYLEFNNFNTNTK